MRTNPPPQFGEDERPALRRIHSGAERLGALAVAREVAMLDLHASLSRAGRPEPYLDFARGVVRRRFAIRSDSEREDEAFSRRVFPDLAPRQLLARAIAFEPDAAGWLDRRVDEVRPRERIPERPPCSEMGREGIERAGWACLYHHMMRNRIVRHRFDPGCIDRAR